MFDWLNNFLIKTMGLPMVASEHGEKIDFFIVYVHWLMLALFLGWTGYFLYTIYRFRASNNPKASYRGVQSHASSYVEIAVAIIEVVLLLGFAIPLWANVVEDEMPLELRTGNATSDGDKDDPSSVFLNPDGDNNAIVIRAKSAGAEHNATGVEFEQWDDMDLSDAVATYDGVTIRIQLAFDRTTASQIVSAIRKLDDWTAELDGDDDMEDGEENNGSGAITEPQSIRVVGEQFFWNARYPGKDGFAAQDFRLVTADNKFGYDLEDDAGKDDAIAPQNEIHVPVGKEVIIHLSSLDVIHSFSLHAMRVGQDCIPGMSIPIHFKPHTEGTYAITCAQLCGNGHYRMRANLTVESQAAFEAWIVENTPEDPAAANQAFE